MLSRKIAIMAGVLVLTSVFVGPVSGYVLLPHDRLTSTSEYAHVNFDETKSSGSSKNWGRGVEAGIEVYGGCNRADGHDIASWVSIFVYDVGASDFRSWHQAGWVQNPNVGNCDVAATMFQSCSWPCDTGDYTPAQFGKLISISDDGLPGLFRLQIGDASGPNPEQPCMFRNTMGLRCPIGMTPDELVTNTCLGTSYFTEGEVACSAEDELVMLASQESHCQDLLNKSLAGYNPFCQGVDAANLALDNAIPNCSDAVDPLDPIFDQSICFISPESGNEELETQGPCHIDFYFDDVYASSSAITVPCARAEKSRIEYEAADNYGNTHSGPGSDDQFSRYISWKHIGTQTLGSVQGDLVFNTGEKATCPPYEGRYKTSSNLVEYAELGPHIDGATDWCGEDLAAAPAPGIIFILGVTMAVFALRRLGVKKHSEGGHL